MGIRELLLGDGPTSLNLEAKGFAYPQQGGQGYGGVYYGSDAYSILNGLTRPTSRDYASVRIELSSALAVCLNTVCNAFPEAELCVEREIVDGEDEREPTHPALMLVERPNPYMSGADVLTAIVRDLMTSTTGSAYLVKRRGAYKRVVELWPVCSSMMRPVWPASGDEFISGYEITIDGERRLIDPMDVIHFHNDIDHAPPSYSRCGIPYLPAVMQDLYTDSAAGDFTAAIMRNMGVPGAILSPRVASSDGRYVTLPPEIRDQFAADYQKRFTGAGRGQAMVLSHPMELQQLGFDPSKMSLREIRQIAEERLSAIYNIPAIVAGFGAGLEHSTYANYEQALKAFWSGCIIPIQRRIATTLTQQLLRVDYPRSEQLYFEFEHDHIKALQESETEKRQRDREDYLAGILTHHQAVSRLGAVPEGDDWMVLPSSVTAYPVNAMPMAETPEPAPPQPALPPAPEEPKAAIPGVELTEKGIAAAGWRVELTGPAEYVLVKADDPGRALDRSETEIADEAEITDEDIADAAAWVRDNVPELADLLDATQKSAPLETKATYRWNPRTRRYIGENGRMVPKAAVDGAMDAAVEVGRAEMAGYADALIAGEMDLPAYQIAMEASIKRMHLAAVATTRGGWANLTPSERGKAARAIQEQYRYLNKSCLAFANGDREVNGRVRATSQMYASSARTAYGELDYDAAKDAAEAQVDTHQERWIRHASDSCAGCVDQASKGWVGLGELPPIGSQQCLSQCRCSKSVRKRPKKG